MFRHRRQEEARVVLPTPGDRAGVRTARSTSRGRHSTGCSRQEGDAAFPRVNVVKNAPGLGAPQGSSVSRDARCVLPVTVERPPSALGGMCRTIPGWRILESAEKPDFIQTRFSRDSGASLVIRSRAFVITAPASQEDAADDCGLIKANLVARPRDSYGKPRPRRLTSTHSSRILAARGEDTCLGI